MKSCKPPCRHCRTRPANRPLGLCVACYYAPGLRAQYPSLSKHAPHTTPRPECWSCGVTAPQKNHTEKIGWHAQTIRFQGATLRELLCPACFAAHGFPPVLEAAPLTPGGAAR